jgi:hypothetical protein
LDDLAPLEVLDVGLCPVSLPPHDHMNVERSSAAGIQARLTARYARRGSMNYS